MKSIYGKNLVISLFGESHSEYIGVTIDGLAPGIKLDLEYIQSICEKRKAKDQLSTARKEKDEFKIVCGYFEGYTTGTPLTILIKNNDVNSKVYEKNILRPSHADYTAFCKYQGYQDYRGGGHFSGRITAPLVVAGAICMQILKEKGIYIASHIKQMLDIVDDELADEFIKNYQILENKTFPCINDEKEQKMKEIIMHCRENQDSIGAKIETVVIGMEAGIGEPFFNSIESRLSSLIFSVPSVKGVSFGLGFDFMNLYGSQANDQIYYDGDIKTYTNHNGGINGGISNGNPIVINTIIKPTPSIYKQQKTINYATKENLDYQIVGRHDPCIAHRANIVLQAVVAIGLLDLLCERYGYMWMVK